MHRPHGGTCCAGWFPTHTPAPICFMTHAISHTWKYVSTIHPNVLDARLGLATLVVPAVQWTTKDSAHVSCKELNKCNLHGEVWTVHLLWGNWMSTSLYKISAFEQIILFFSLAYKCNFFSIVFWRTRFLKGRDSAFSLDSTFISTIRTADWPGSAGLATEHRWYVRVGGVFSQITKCSPQTNCISQCASPNQHNALLFRHLGSKGMHVCQNLSAETEACQRLNGQE